eukprot:GEMP01022353.1.p1 GENE.GEMP01022353.1~~GEMP01022353.1.p1  ORF type:complete len:687 (+),score=198.31 GEMP01022353.1:13-2073(+)
MTLEATLLDVDPAGEFQSVDRFVPSPDTCSSIDHESAHVRTQILEAQVADLTTRLKLAHEGDRETTKICEDLRRDHEAVTTKNRQLEDIVEQERDKLVHAAQLAMEAASKRLDNEELKSGLNKQVHDLKRELEEERRLAQPLRKQLEENEQVIREQKEVVKQTEAAFKSKQCYDDTWSEIHKSNREKIHELEEELQKVKKENHALPVIRQQLTHAERQARESVEEAHLAAKERTLAIGRLQEIEDRLDALTDTNDELQLQRDAAQRKLLAFSAEKSSEHLRELRFAEAEELAVRSKRTADDLARNLSVMENKWNEEKTLRNTISNELQDVQDEYRKACAELNRIQQERTLRAVHEQMQKREMETQAEEVAKLREEKKTLQVAKQQLAQAEAQVTKLREENNALQVAKQQLAYAEAQVTKLREENNALQATKQALVHAEAEVREVRQGGVVAKQMAADARRVAAELQVAEQHALEDGNKFAQRFASLQEEHRALRASCAEFLTGKLQEQFESAIAELRLELQDAKMRHATELQARTHAERVLNEHEETHKQRTARRVSRGSSPIRDDVLLKMQDQLDELRVENSEVIRRRTVADDNLMKQRAFNEKIIARMSKRLTKANTAHEDLREIYVEHIGLIRGRKTVVTKVRGSASSGRTYWRQSTRGRVPTPTSGRDPLHRGVYSSAAHIN